MHANYVKRITPQPDEITVRIIDDAGIILGELTCPAGITLEGTAAGADSDEQLGIHQALASAIEIADAHGLTIGVIDDHGIWREEWGDLQHSA